MDNIVDIASGSPDFNILVQALTAADLVTTIQNSNDITVFAPTDAAFGRLAVDLGFDGDPEDETAVLNFIVATLTALDPNDDPIPLLTQILTYHVAPGALDSAAVLATTTIGTLEGTDITRDGLVLVDQEPDIINPALDVAGLDIIASNGIIHTIDHVLLPLDVPGNDAPSIVEIAVGDNSGPDENPGDTDLLVAALAAAGLVDAVSDADLTVFAPTDAAFVTLANDLGFVGSDEAGALNFIVGTLTALGGGDPIPLLTAILTYHVSPGAQQLANIAAAGEISTLQGGTITVDGTTLVDAEPDIADPSLALTDIQASDGIVHVIDRVLLPVDIPASNGANAVQVLLGTDMRDRLEGGEDNDLIIGAGGPDLLIGGMGDDTFVLAGDGARAKILDFGTGTDLVDISDWGIANFDHLTVKQRNDSSLLVFDGDNSVVLESADGPILASSLTADSFVFGTQEDQTLTGTADRDRLEGGSTNDTFDGLEGRDSYIGNGGSDTFILGADTADKVIDFVDGEDLLDVSNWGVTEFSGLEVLTRNDASFYVRAGSNIGVIQTEAGFDPASITADDFIFA